MCYTFEKERLPNKIRGTFLKLTNKIFGIGWQRYRNRQCPFLYPTLIFERTHNLRGHITWFLYFIFLGLLSICIKVLLIYCFFLLYIFLFVSTLAFALYLSPFINIFYLQMKPLLKRSNCLAILGSTSFKILSIYTLAT